MKCQSTAVLSASASSPPVERIGALNLGEGLDQIEPLNLGKARERGLLCRGRSALG
jgi:hypothetical protein